MQVWKVLHAARCKCRTQKSRQKSPSGHHPTTLSGYIFVTKACIDSRKKNLLSSNISSTCPYNMVNFGPLAAEMVSLVWGTPGNFNGFRVLLLVVVVVMYHMWSVYRISYLTGNVVSLPGHLNCMFSGSCCWFTSLTVGVGGAVAVSGGSVKADACVCFSLVEVISSNSNNLGSHN